MFLFVNVLEVPHTMFYTVHQAITPLLHAFLIVKFRLLSRANTPCGTILSSEKNSLSDTRNFRISANQDSRYI